MKYGFYLRFGHIEIIGDVRDRLAVEISADEDLPHFLGLSIEEFADEVSDLLGVVPERARILDTVVKLLK